MIVVLMGVAGSGKTTVGHALAERLGWTFLEGDLFHPGANVRKMASGIALTDDERWPWLDRLAGEMRSIGERGRSAVVACSALKQAYRDRLTGAGDVRFVYLKGDAAAIALRLAARKDHYMPPSLLASQFAALEEPADALVIDVRLSPDEQVAAIAYALEHFA